MSTLMGRFALPPPVPVPMMRRLTEYSASWVKIPARIAGMPQAVWNRPVTRPASIPASVAATRATPTDTPLSTSTTQTAPPVPREPSTVRSATSRMR